MLPLPGAHGRSCLHHRSRCHQEKILDPLRLPSVDPPRAASRFERREEQEEMFEGWGDETAGETEEGHVRTGRDPPGEF